MLRVLIAAVLIANLAFFAWSQGWLDAVVGARSIGDREPERLQRQVRPETIQILAPEAASAAASAASAPVALGCFEAGPYADAELTAAQTAAQAALPGAAWAVNRVDQPGVWLVYMGRYVSHEAQLRKEDEIKRRNLPYEEIVQPPALAPGLALGRYPQRAAAEAALAQFTQQGVRTARVVELAPPGSRTMLRVDQVDAALATRIAALKPDAVLGRGLAACATAAGT